MLSVIAQRRLTLLLLAGVPLAALAGLGWFAWQSPHSRFLPPDGAAEWIHYPVPPQLALVAERYEWQAVFRRTFELTAVPAQARLRVRAVKDCSLQLNGRPVALPGGERGNQVRTAEVADQLRSGPNDIRAVVANDVGPPLLWLALEGPGWSVRSDDRWSVSLDGAVECPAHLAGQPLPLRPGNPAWGGDRTVESFQARLPTLLLFALLAAGVLLLARIVFGGRAGGVSPLLDQQRANAPRSPVRGADATPLAPRFSLLAPSPLAAGLLAAMVLWLVLFGHNALATPPFPMGFDCAYHQAYIQYIQQHKALPLADEGWEMHHPPLFYLLAAGLLGGCGLAPRDAGGVLVLRLMGLAAGLAELVLVAACLRLLFPAQPRRQLAGLALAAFLPAQLYTCHYITNEWLLTVLGTAALYLCLRLLRDERPTMAQHALLGLCLGAALLTKVTAIVVAGVVLLVLAGRLLARRERRPGAWLRSVGVTLLAAVLVSGWHYARVWTRFGTPLVGNFDPASGFRFWQDPGYACPAYLVRFGQALVDPFYSALQSLPDGLYTTFWGDGLCGGVNMWNHRLPWNYDLMAAGYLLALVPSLVIGIGLGVVLLQLLRRPQAEGFLLLGVVGGLAVALLFQFLRYPYYGHARAAYQLTALVPFCAFAAQGFGVLARLGRLAAAVLAIVLGTWACTAYTAFWIPANAATYNWVGLQQLGRKHPGEADLSFKKASAADPHAVPPRLNRAVILLPGRQRDQARRLIEDVLRDDPDNADALLGRAMFLQAEGQVGEALEALRRAGERAPDLHMVYSLLGGILLIRNQQAEAIAAYRQALRIQPAVPADRANLALLLARTGRIHEAIAQYRRALALHPDHAVWLADLAWILATQEAARYRAPEEALRLAEEACRRTEYRDTVPLQALAAAQAACGRYLDARNTARQAAEVATSTGPGNRLAPIEDQIQHYDKGEPFYAGAPPWGRPYAPVSARPVDE